MGKTGKTVTKATYGILNLVTKPLYDQMRKETKELDKRCNKSLAIASVDAIAEVRRFEVHQPYDAIVHHHPLW